MKKLVSTVAGATILFAGASFTSPTAHAAPNWVLYNVDTGTDVAVNDVLSWYGTLSFTMSINFFATRIQCQVAHGSSIFTHAVTSSDQLSAAPGDDISVTFTPDATISSSDPVDPRYDICEDISGTTFGSGVPLDVTTSQASMSVVLSMPPTGTPGVYSGNLAVHLSIPDGEFNVFVPDIGCHIQGPYSGTGEIDASYDAGTGVLTPTARSFDATSPDCVAQNTQLESGSISLDPQLSLNY